MCRENYVEFKGVNMQYTFKEVYISDWLSINASFSLPSVPTGYVVNHRGWRNNILLILKNTP